jgi:sec-independent protein translocase protein TatA
MNFFGMGVQEIGVIMIVALIIFGPGKLPEVMGQVGKAVRDFRRLTTDMTSEFEKSTGIKDIKKTLQDEITGVKNEVAGVGTSVQKEIQSASNTVSSTAKAATSSSTTTSTSSPAATSSTSTSTSSTATNKSTTAAPVATKKDPLADLVVFDEIAPSDNGTSGPADSASSAGSNGSSSDATPALASDALSRARLRRQQAGYNRPPASVG